MAVAALVVALAALALAALALAAVVAWWPAEFPNTYVASMGADTFLGP